MSKRDLNENGGLEELECRISLRLELDAGSEPIRGHLVAGDGSVEEFSGWLALAAAIEHAQTHTKEKTT